MILSITRTALTNLSRDRAALLLCFVLPIVFFSIFAAIFGSAGRQAATPRIKLVVVDEDKSGISTRFLKALESEPSLVVPDTPERKKNVPAQPYDANTAEAAVRNGDVRVALIIPRGFGDSPIAFGPRTSAHKLELLSDTSDPVAPQIVAGLLQKTAMVSMPDVMAETGVRYIDQWAGGLSEGQHKAIEENMKMLKQRLAARAGTNDSVTQQNYGLVPVEVRDVLGATKKNPFVAYYAAGIGVLFLLFTASSAGGALLDESETGTLDRILSGRVSMTKLLLGKLAFLVLLNVTQLVVMFTWAAAVFQLDLVHHAAGFLLMAVATAATTSTFGLMLAAACRTRAQLAAFSTMVVLVVSALGGSMVPRFIMSECLQRVGLLTFNAWAIEGFTKVFWREVSVLDLWPNVVVLLAFGLVFFAISRRLAVRWERV
jgi:ABC-2 type transport system permease protein